MPTPLSPTTSLSLSLSLSLSIPHWNRYGSEGYPAWEIPPNVRLVFEIEVLFLYVQFFFLKIDVLLVFWIKDTQTHPSISLICVDVGVGVRDSGSVVLVGVGVSVCVCVCVCLSVGLPTDHKHTLTNLSYYYELA